MLVAVYGWGDGEPPYVMLKGDLHQGEADGADWDYFGVGQDAPPSMWHSSGIYLSRAQFVEGHYEDERLTIVMGRVGITVEPDNVQPGAAYEPPDV